MARDLKTIIPGVPAPMDVRKEEYKHREYPKHITVGGYTHTVHNEQDEKALLAGVAGIAKEEQD